MSKLFFHVKTMFKTPKISVSQKKLIVLGGDPILPFENSDIIALYFTRVPGNDSYWMTMCGLTQGKLLEGGILSCR